MDWKGKYYKDLALLKVLCKGISGCLNNFLDEVNQHKFQKLDFENYRKLSDDLVRLDGLLRDLQIPQKYLIAEKMGDDTNDTI